MFISVIGAAAAVQRFASCGQICKLSRLIKQIPVVPASEADFGDGGPCVNFGTFLREGADKDSTLAPGIPPKNSSPFQAGVRS